MKIHRYPGFFIDIEGIDGCGANTQVKILSKCLTEKKINHFITKEPTDSPIGKLIRQIIKDDFLKYSPSSLRLLFAADGSLHLDKEIIPRLKKGELVITDRYAWASIAYGSLYLSKEWLFDLNKDFIFPDITIFINVSPKICLERLKKEKKSLELYEKLEEFEDTQETYNWLAARYWWAPVVTINGERTKKEISEDIYKIIINNPKFKYDNSF